MSPPVAEPVMDDTRWLEIDLARLDANVAALRRLVGPRTALCGVVKADAYGLGAVPIARRLERLGAAMLAVYSADQARALLDAGIRAELLLLMPVRTLEHAGPLGEAMRQGRLHLSVHDRAQAESLDRLGRAAGTVLPVHLYLDTGMSRAGLSAPQFAAICQDLGRFPALRVRGVYTHFAAAEEDVAFTEHQMAQLDAALAAWRGALGEDLLVHAANTAAVHRDRRFHRSMVRVGLGLFGYGPQLMSGPLLSAEPGVQPIVRWVSRIVHLQRYPRGETVGYNRTRRLDRDSLLALVPVGYADGYPLSLGNRGVVQVAGPTGERACSAAVLGKVNMDQIVIDLTDSPHAARLGAEVELLGRDADSPCPLHRLAALAGSNCYEMLCRLSARLPRVYLG